MSNALRIRHAPIGNPGRRRSRGQAIVETALILPVFLLLLFGIIDGGRFVYTDSVLSQAAREGARLGAVEAGFLDAALRAADPSCVAVKSAINPAVNPGAHVCPANTTDLLAHVREAANREIAGVGTVSQIYLRCDPAGTVIAPGWVSASPPTCTTHDKGSVISVRVEFLYRPLTPIAGQIIGSVTRTASATMAIN